MNEERYTKEQLSVFERFAVEERKIREQAKTDLVMLEGDEPNPGSLSAPRLRAAYALANERILEKWLALEDRFRHFGVRVPDGLTSLMLMRERIVVGPGAKVVLTTMTQTPFKPLFLLFDTESARSFDLLSIIVGVEYVGHNVGRIPCKLFTRENHIFGALKIPAIQVGQSISVTLENVSTREAVPECALFGVGLDALGSFHLAVPRAPYQL